MAKKTSFFEKVVSGVTGKTKEQRRADALLKSKIRQRQLASFRAEQLKQADIIGKRRAEIQAQQQIKQMSQPKKSGLIDLGGWGKTQANFDPMTFGSSSGTFRTSGKKKKKLPSVDDYLKSVPS